MWDVEGSSCSLANDDDDNWKEAKLEGATAAKSPDDELSVRGFTNGLVRCSYVIFAKCSCI